METKIVIRFLTVWFPILLLALLWQLCVSIGVLPDYIISSPAQILSDFVKLIKSGRLVTHSFYSTLRLLAGLAIGVPMGISCAILFHMFPRSTAWADALLGFLAQVPPVAWVPVTIAVAGIGNGSKVMLVAMCTFFVIFINVSDGCRQISNSKIRILQLYPNSKSWVAYNIYTKGSMPSILSGLGLSVMIGWIVLIASELVGSSNGLGWFVWDSRNFGRTSDMMVGVLTLGLIGIVLVKLIERYSTYALYWQDRNNAKLGQKWASK